MEDQVELDEDKCVCKGTGWLDVSSGPTIECPHHFRGQLHPDTQALLFDEPSSLAEEERKSLLRFQIKETREKVAQLQADLRSEQTKLVYLELELVNRTPTVKAMQAVVPVEPEPMEIDDWEEL